MMQVSGSGAAAGAVELLKLQLANRDRAELSDNATVAEDASQKSGGFETTRVPMPRVSSVAGRTAR